jgi:hypothetical protein
MEEVKGIEGFWLEPDEILIAIRRPPGFENNTPQHILVQSLHNVWRNFGRVVDTQELYQPRVCNWKTNGDSWDGYYWETGCGEAWEFTVDGPKENGCKFCMYCGGVLVQLEEEKIEEEEEDNG